MIYEKEKEVAIACVTAAAKLCETVRQANKSQAIEKPDNSPVTIADFGAQAIICQALDSVFPEDPVIGEEDASLLLLENYADSLALVVEQVQNIIPSASKFDVIEWINRGNGKVSNRYWTLDPIDGTKGFIRGDQYAIALALIEQGEVKLGILGCPALRVNDSTGCIFLAIKGQGCLMLSLLDGTPQQISVNKRVDSSEIIRIESFETRNSDRELQKKLDEILGLKIAPIQMDSEAKYGVIASGDADLYLRIPIAKVMGKENIWDHAPGIILVEEAGGCVTDLDGKMLDFSVGAKLTNNRGVVASNGVIHQKVLEALALVLGNGQ